MLIPGVAKSSPPIFSVKIMFIPVCMYMLSTQVYKISHLNFKPLLRKLLKTPEGLLFYAAPCR